MSLSESPIYSYNRGHLWMGDAVAGAMPTKYPIDIAALDNLEVTFSPTYVEHMNKSASVALKDVKAVSEMSGTGKITCSQRQLAMLLKWLYGSSTTISGGSFAATALLNPVVVGDIVPAPLAKSNLSSVVVTDSAGSPATLVLGTDYELDADAGLIKILSLGSYTQPFKMAATEGASTGVNFFQSVPALQGMLFLGNNILNNGVKEIVQIPKLQFSPSGAWKLLGDGNTAAQFEWDFEILADTSNLVYPFGRIKVAS